MTAQESRLAAALSEPQDILFVCEHGSAKSVIAAAHFNRLASEKGLPYRAITRGVNPDQEIPPTILRGLAADGLDVAGWKPQKVGVQGRRQSQSCDYHRLLSSGDQINQRGEGYKINDIPNVSGGYEAAQKAIVDRVTELLDSLVKK